MKMQDFGSTPRWKWIALLAMHAVIFVLGYMITMRVIWGLVVILTRGGSQIDLIAFVSKHSLWTATAAGFAVGLIGLAGIRAAFGQIKSSQSFVREPSLFVCVVFFAWFIVGVSRWVLGVISQQSVLVAESPRWFADFADTFFLTNCPSGWLIHLINVDSCSNQLLYTTLFVASLGYAASRLVGMIGTHHADPQITNADNSADA